MTQISLTSFPAGIIFFDGYCNLCNGLINWLLKMDHAHRFQFATLQSETAKKIFGHKFFDPETLIYLKGQKRFEKSTAVLQILKELGGFWVLGVVFFVIPKFFRDSIYTLIAKNRYRIFGKSSVCRIPTPQERARFLP